MFYNDLSVSQMTKFDFTFFVAEADAFYNKISAMTFSS